MELPKPEDVNFYEMRRGEQNAYYARHVRGLIAWMLEQDDFPDKFRRQLKAVDDYTYYLGYEVGASHLLKENNA